MLGKLILLFLLLSAGGSSSDPNQKGPGYGGGGVQKQEKTKGKDGTDYLITYYGDGSRMVQTSYVGFWVIAPNLATPVRVVFGTSADVARAVQNLPS